MATSQIPSTHPALYTIPPIRAMELPLAWSEAAQKALIRSDWAGNPQARVVQAIILKIGSSRPRTQGPEGNFYIWLSVAIRICEMLGLHKLGTSSSIMPVDDAAWPVAPCALKRELAKRVWWVTIAQEWMFSSASAMAMEHIAPGSCESKRMPCRRCMR